MHLFKILLRKDLLTMKNFIKDLVTSPKRLLPFVIILGFIVLQISGISKSGGMEESAIGSEITGAKLSVISAIFTLVVLGLILYELYKAVSTPPTFFRMPDVNLLFTAPFSPRKILAYYIVRSNFLLLLLALPFTIYILFLLGQTPGYDISLSLFPYLAVAGFVMLLAPLKFLIFSLETKFGIKHIIKTAVFSIIALITISIAILFLTATDSKTAAIFDGLNHPMINYMPVIGWLKTTFFTPFSGFEIYPIVAVLLQFITIAVVTYLCVRFGDDYYEHIIAPTQAEEKKRRQQKGVEKLNLSTFTFRKKKEFKHGKSGKGLKAFIWKSTVEYKRSDVGVYFNFGSIFYLILGISGGLLAHKVGKGEKVLFILNGLMFYILFIFSMVRSRNSKFTSHYLFLIPGTNFQRIVYPYYVDIVRTFINALVMNFSAGLLADASWPVIIVLSLFITSFFIINIFAGFVLRVLFPSSADQKILLPFLIMVQLIFLILPGVIAGVLAAFLFRTPLAFFAGVTALNIFMICAVLAYGDEMFEELELR